MPNAAAGCRAATSMASAMLAHSITSKPAIHVVAGFVGFAAGGVFLGLTRRVGRLLHADQ